MDKLAEPTVSVDVSRTSWCDGLLSRGTRSLPEETGISFVFNGTTHGVMMGTPEDLEDFAVGYALNADIVRSPRDIKEVDIVAHANGLELRLWLASQDLRRMRERRRYLVGPTGCGLCGLESLDDAAREPPVVRSDLAIDVSSIATAMTALTDGQDHGRRLRALHAAAFWTERRGLVALREDVGRHNALDKLAGALAKQGVEPGSGIVAITSRVSIEMIQKAATMGVPVLLAISVPTALAVRVAQRCNITLVGIVRANGFEVFSHPQRIRFNEPLGDAAGKDGEA